MRSSQRGWVSWHSWGGWCDNWPGIIVNQRVDPAGRGANNVCGVWWYWCCHPDASFLLWKESKLWCHHGEPCSWQKIHRHTSYSQQTQETSKIIFQEYMHLAVVIQHHNCMALEKRQRWKCWCKERQCSYWEWQTQTWMMLYLRQHHLYPSVTVQRVTETCQSRDIKFGCQ